MRITFIKIVRKIYKIKNKQNHFILYFIHFVFILFKFIHFSY